ncbi:MAG TPA: hypothetical protein VHW01_07445 [Polyangiaceae bacterium]|nr:hypothetical protein [Polyangiaceae bacterium]
MPSCNAAKRPKFLATVEETCTGAWHSIRPVDATPSVPSLLWSNATGTCLPYRPGTDATYCATGAVIPTSMFVSATPEP